MMKKNRNKPSTSSILTILTFSTLLTLSTLFTLSSCETTEKIDDFPLRPSRMVVNCFFNENLPFGIQVSKSLSVLDNADLKLIDNATVKLLKNGELLETLTLMNEAGFYTAENYFPEPDSLYSVEVTAPGFEQVLRAEDVAPQKVDLTEVTIQIRDSSFYEWKDSRDRIRYSGNLEGSFVISLKDPGNQENYYELSVFYLDTADSEYGHVLKGSVYRRSLLISSEDAALDNGKESSAALLFRDILFDGQSYQLKLDFHDWQARRDRLYFVELTSLRQAGYLYKRSIRDYYQARNDPFAEPVQIFGNIQNGYGIFSGFAVDQFAVGF